MIWWIYIIITIAFLKNMTIIFIKENENCIGINVACSSIWNILYGLPYAIDFKYNNN